MFVAPKDNKWDAKYYGTAAISTKLGGGKWNSEGCGKCFKISTKSSAYGKNERQTVILKATNWCASSENNECGKHKAHF